MRRTPDEPLVPGALDKYGHDLTALARQGRFAPLEGHDKEVERVLQVLARPRRYNPMLIGEDSTECFAIIGEVTRRISIGAVPEEVKIKRVVALDLEMLITGAQTPADFAKLLESVVAEGALSERQLLLFIDKMRTLLGGGWTKGTIDAAHVLMPALSRGQIVLIGAFTADDYRTYMMTTAARYRRCEQIVIREFRE